MMMVVVVVNDGDRGGGNGGGGVCGDEYYDDYVHSDLDCKKRLPIKRLPMDTKRP